jgi:hypothetical protein
MTTQELQDNITKLTDKWRKLAASDHCKDRDFHFYINTVWSYGQKQKYRVEHYGYLYKDVEETFDTYREAAEYLVKTLKTMIEREKNIEETLD